MNSTQNFNFFGDYEYPLQPPSEDYEETALCPACEECLQRSDLNHRLYCCNCDEFMNDPDSEDDCDDLDYEDYKERRYGCGGSCYDY